MPQPLLGADVAHRLQRLVDFADTVAGRTEKIRQFIFAR